jgi:multiple sugar transport system permease protein
MNARIRESVTAFWFLAPFLVALIVFFAFAFVRTVYFSFTDYNLFDQLNFVGLRNYFEVPRDPLFLTALKNTLVFSIVVTFVQTLGSLLLAVVLNQKLNGLSFFRTAYYFPSIASSAVTTLIFIWLFRPTGIVAYLSTQIGNYGGLILVFLLIATVLQVVQVLFERSRALPATWFDPALLLVSLLVGLIGAGLVNALGWVQVGNQEPVALNWLSTQEQFLGLIPYPLLTIMVMNSFTTIPTLMLTFLAGLQGISKSVYEAASIDGANPIQQTLYMTVPLLRPVTFYVITISIIGTLQMFDQASILAGTAPLESTITLAYYVYNSVFRGGGESLVGIASAAALILSLLTLLIVQLQRRFFIADEGSTR